MSSFFFLKTSFSWSSTTHSLFRLHPYEVMRSQLENRSLLFSCSVVSNSLWPHGLPGSSVHGISQARILECHFFLQRIFPTQGSNLGLLHCKQILYHLNHQGSPWWCWAELNTISASISFCIWGCKLWALWETISYLSTYSKCLACTRSLINAYWKQNITEP